jgi:hypothetical protein
MKHLALSFTLLAPATSLTWSQPQFTLKVGGVASNWRGNGMSVFSDVVYAVGSEFVRQQGITSFYAGAALQLPITERLSLEPGLQYSRTGAGLKGNLAFKALQLLGINAGARAISNRIELPVMLKLEVAKGLFVMAGPQVNYAFDSRLNLRAGVLGINLLNQNIPLDNLVDPFSASAVGGLQYQFENGFQLQAAYEHGLSRIAINNSADIYQNAIRVGAGIPLFRQ